MSFSITTAMASPNDVIADFSKQAANNPQCPPKLTDAINDQLMRLPGTTKAKVTASGHTGWGQAQTKGQITINVTIDVVDLAASGVGEIRDEDPQPA